MDLMITYILYNICLIYLLYIIRYHAWNADAPVARQVLGAPVGPVKIQSFYIYIFIYYIPLYDIKCAWNTDAPVGRQVLGAPVGPVKTQNSYTILSDIV